MIRVTCNQSKVFKPIYSKPFRKFIYLYTYIQIETEKKYNMYLK